MIIGADEIDAPRADLAARWDIVGRALALADHEGPVRQPRRHPGDDVVIVVADPRHDRCDALGHRIVHEGIAAPLLVAPFPARGGDGDGGRILPPRRDRIAALLEEAGIVIGRRRRGAAGIVDDMLVGHHRHRLGDDHPVHERAGIVDQRREIEHVLREGRLQPCLQFLRQVEPRRRPEALVGEALVDRLVLGGERVGLRLGAGHEEQHAPLRLRQLRLVAVAHEVEP